GAGDVGAGAGEDAGDDGVRDGAGDDVSAGPGSCGAGSSAMALPFSPGGYFQPMIWKCGRGTSPNFFDGQVASLSSTTGITRAPRNSRLPMTASLKRSKAI